MIVFCAFAFDPEAAKDIDALKGITALKAQMNTDLLTEDLKKASSKSTTNQSFWLMGQPDVHLTALPDGLWQVEVNGFDYFDTAKGELVSGGKDQDCGMEPGHRLRRAQPVPASVLLPDGGQGRRLDEVEEGHSRRAGRRPAQALCWHRVAAV
jgi:adenine-specific DNA-methyltransferase